MSSFITKVTEKGKGKYVREELLQLHGKHKKITGFLSFEGSMHWLEQNKSQGAYLGGGFFFLLVGGV